MAESNVSIARDELLIVFDYLINYTDEKHLTTQKKIIDYAKKNYQVDIRRQRIGPILEYLKDIISKHPEKFPFVLKECSTGQRNKYYVDQRIFSDEEIIQIIRAIYNDRYTTKEDSDDFVQRFLKITANKYQRKEITELVAQEKKGKYKYTRRVLNNLKILEEAIKTRGIVEFSLPSKKTYVLSADEWDDSTINKKAYAYKIIDFNHNPYVIMVDFDSKKLITYSVTEMKNLKTISMYDNPNDALDINARFADDNYENIERYLQDAYLPAEGGIITPISFRFRHSEYNFITINESYKEYFNKEMIYENKKQYYKKTDGTIVNENEYNAKDDICITYIHVSLKANSRVFIKWATRYDVASIIEVTGSHIVVQQLIYHYSRVFHKSKSSNSARAKKTALYMQARKEIFLAAKAGIPDPKRNVDLQRAIDNYENQNVPKAIIEEAIKLATKKYVIKKS
jgi:hypothetical protein